MTNHCVFSPCRTYRYTLEHPIVLNPAEPRRIMWIGLNPSTANEQQLDPTLRRIRRFSADLGFTSFVMTNLFAYRATDPSVMKQQTVPTGLYNDDHLLNVANQCEQIVAAWGAHGSHLGRDAQVAKLLRGRLYCLGLTKEGFPKHPLARGKAFIPYGTPLTLFA